MPLPIEFRAFVIAIIVFTILQFILTLVSINVINTATDVQTLVPWINAVAYFLYVVTGFVVGVIAKRGEIVNGVIGGILAATTAILMLGVAGRDLFGAVALLIEGGILGGVGGACVLLLTRRKTSAE